MVRIFAVLLVLVVSLTLPDLTKVQALSCEKPGPLSEELARSAVVFKGEVVATYKDGQTIFEVQTAWKGVADSRIEMYDNGWDPYVPGQTYLVLGANRDGELRTQLCGWSGPWDATRENAVEDAGLKPISIAKMSGDDVGSGAGGGGNGAGAGGNGSGAGGNGAGGSSHSLLHTSVAWTLVIAFAVTAIVLAGYFLFRRRRDAS